MAEDRNLDGNLDPHTPYQHSLQATTISPPIFPLSTIIFKLALPSLHLSLAHPPPCAHVPQGVGGRNPLFLFTMIVEAMHHATSH